MKGAPDVEDLRLWAVVAATVRPLRPASTINPLPPNPTPAPQPTMPAVKTAETFSPQTTRPRPAPGPPAHIDAGLRRRLTRGRETLAARIDLHGLDQDRARAALTRFIERAVDEGWRAALVITGKGAGGDGVLKRRVPDWLGAAPIRQYVAGVSEAHRRHGGEGALYVALKRKR
jgi:DNA-nicking Smr family endonuclease